MVWKNIVFGLGLVMLQLLVAGQAVAEEGQCAQLINTVCIGCHNSDRVCDSMGGPAKKWQAILDWMISNGAELADEETTLLINCLTEPYEEARKACGK